MVDGVSDGTPDVDDTDPAFQEARSFVAEVTVNSSDAGVVGLINVDSFLIYYGQFRVTSYNGPWVRLTTGPRMIVSGLRSSARSMIGFRLQTLRSAC